MKKLIFLVLIGIMSFPSFGNSAAISVSADQNKHTLVVYVNGKLVNNSRKRYVRHRSLPGFHVVKVKVYDNNGKFITVLNQRIYIKSGFENNYHIQLSPDKKSLKKMPLYPIYSSFFFNPSLYSRNGTIT